MNLFDDLLRSINDRILHAFGFARQNRLEVHSREATSSKSDLNNEGQRCGQSEDKSTEDEYFTAEEPNTNSSNVTPQKSAGNCDVSYVNRYKPNIKASSTPTDHGKANDGQNITVCCDSSKSGSKINTKKVKETPKQIKCIADPKTLVEIARNKSDAVNIQRSPTQHRTVNSTFLTNIAAVSKPTESYSLRDIETNPGLTLPTVSEASKLDIQSCTKKKEFKGKVIGEETDERDRGKTNSKGTEKKQTARKPKNDPKPSGIHSSETDHEKLKQSPQNTPKVLSTIHYSPNLESCTEGKEFTREVIREGTGVIDRNKTDNKRTEKKTMARQPKDDPKHPGIHSTETDDDKQKQCPQYTQKMRSTTQDSPNLQLHSVESVSHQASCKARKLNKRGGGLLDKNKPNKTAADQAQTDTLDKIVVSLKTGKPSLTSNTDTLSSCKTTKYRSPSITTNNGPKEMVQPINKTAEENVAVVKPKIVAVCSKQTGTKNKNNKSQKDVFVKEEKPNRSDLGKERNHCDAAALPINKHLLSDPVYDMPQNGEFSLAFLSKKLCLDHDNMHHHFHVYPPHIRESKKSTDTLSTTTCTIVLHVISSFTLSVTVLQCCYS